MLEKNRGRVCLCLLAVVPLGACAVKHNTTIIENSAAGSETSATATPVKHGAVSATAAAPSGFQSTDDSEAAKPAVAAPADAGGDAAGQRYDASRQNGDSYAVGPHDTLYSIAFRNKLDFRNLAEWNRIDPPYAIHPGEVLRLSAPGSTAAPATAATAAAPATAAAVSSNSAATAKPAAAPAPSPATAKPDEAAASTPAQVVANSASRSASGIRWSWPASGKVIKRFQAADAIPGLEIAGQAGDPVRAAADGVVVYSGDGLVGYGELVIVKHSDSLLSAYAHNSKRLVSEGAQVKRGQQIATMGSSGAAQVALEFQVRQNGTPVDPVSYLPSTN